MGPWDALGLDDLCYFLLSNAAVPPKLFPQHLVEGLLNFRRRVSRSPWLDLPFPDPHVQHSQEIVVVIVVSIFIVRPAI